MKNLLVRPVQLGQANEVWLQLQAFWASEDFRQVSSKNKANRPVNPATSSTVYRGGSSSIGMHKRKLVRGKLGRPPKQMELFKRCYKKKDDSSWNGPRAVEVAETFQKLMEDHQPQPTADDGPAESEASVAMTEQQMWLAAVGEKNKNHVFGLGSEAHCTTRTYTSLSPPPHPHLRTRPWRTALPASRG
ncbi:UNVERIFIED_CONTAM: hypothetical protein Slati_1150900 [Sesamum latifolium]|uniref:Uncharacterized protein n=1 Tax=Sesamum latifolium TaxID=2727402 RepID=A0AAW2XDI2_9LAMI